MMKFKRALSFLILSVIVLSVLLLPLSNLNATNLNEISVEDYIGNVLKEDNEYFYITENKIYDLSDDYSLIPQLALGINNENLSQISVVDSSNIQKNELSKRLSGKFLLAVEDYGRLWYVDPVSEERTEIQLGNINQSLSAIAIDLNKISVNNDENQVSSEIMSLLNLVNLERQKYNLAELKLDLNLSEVAFDKAEEMLQENYFAHIGPNALTPGQRLNRFAYPWEKMGENLAKSYSANLTAEQAFHLWMNSPKHKENILNPEFQYIGLAFDENYAVQEFVKN